MELILIRHAQAKDVDGNQVKTDFERPLTPKGVKQAKNLGKALKGFWHSDAIFLSSPLARAWETTTNLCEKIATPPPPFEFCAELGIPIDFDKLKVILQEKRANQVFMVGHMNDLAFFAAKILGCPGGALHFRKGAAASLIWEGDLRWGTGRLNWWINPEWLPEGA
ncbi:MAG: histidine phosphatase family protein [Planctomycetota bacterium]|nr:histidine phosphatase family protein [Planctomycetota bacterium]